MLAILLLAPDNGVCGNYATTPVPACSAHYGSQSAYAPGGLRTARAGGPGRARAPGARAAPSRGAAGAGLAASTPAHGPQRDRQPAAGAGAAAPGPSPTPTTPGAGT